MDYKPPAGPPPGYSQQQFSSNNPYRNHAGTTGQQETYQPPPGPPPSQRSNEYQPPPGPPLSKKTEKYDAPPSHEADEPAPPPYAPWLAVPDNALLPPPPALQDDYSPANNASEADAHRARAWCVHNRLWGPRTWTTDLLEQIDGHHLTLAPQPGMRTMSIREIGPGRTSLSSNKRQGDTTILSNLPLFTPQLRPQPDQERTIHFQVHIKHLSGSDATVAIGFVAPPYPPDRLPGWHRGSLAVHNDDGRRYVNDDNGGIDFVRPFFAGERVGVGMTFSSSLSRPTKVKIFFTRNGREEGSWDLHESRDIDADEAGVTGLEGDTDLYAAIGVCGGAELEIDWT